MNKKAKKTVKYILLKNIFLIFIVMGVFIINKELFPVVMLVVVVDNLNSFLRLYKRLR